ncbi:hypothetical protein [Enterobacter kobei]|uniref:hypothetical protein n=1 Tax=Enterobacter kobei TaxID=208224 RepID=UPI00079C7667|nr:hypothetical protein [Enterobacter kobei]SAF46113.1 Uncharacterised protein [Enterobacter kobei]
MSNIDKQALREKFERWWEVNYHNGNPPRFGWESWREGDGYKTDDDDSELDGMWEAWQAAHSSKMEAAEKRIAEQRETLLAARSYVMQCARWGDAHSNGVLQAIDRAAAGKGE